MVAIAVTPNSPTMLVATSVTPVATMAALPATAVTATHFGPRRSSVTRSQDGTDGGRGGGDTETPPFNYRS